MSSSGFLTAVLQNHARKESVSVDSLKFEFKVTPGPDDSEESLSDVKGHINVREVAFKVRHPCFSSSSVERQETYKPLLI